MGRTLISSYISSIDISNEASKSVLWSQGSFSASVSKTLTIMEMEEFQIQAPEVTCEYALDKTPYKEVRWQRIPPRPNIFTMNPTNSGSNGVKIGIISVFLPILLSL